MTLSSGETIAIRPLDADTWADIEALFEQPGGHRHCWCMAWRLRSPDYNALDDAGRKTALHTLMQAGTPLGVLAYRNGLVAGWCSVAPRESYIRVERSNTFPRLDEQPVWTVMCFYISPAARGEGLALALLNGAAAYAFSLGAQIIEGYPIETQYDARGKPKRDPSANMGIRSVFEKAGFHLAGQTPKGRGVMRRYAADRAEGKEQER